MTSWLDGDLYDLVLEGRTIQRRSPTSHQKYNQKRLARSFANLMFEGKTKAVIHLLTEEAKGGMLHLGDHVDTNKTVSDVLIDQQPPSQPAHPDSLIEADPPEVHPVLVESIIASMTRSVALRTTSATGPSGLHVVSWRRLCTSSSLPPTTCAKLLQPSLSVCAQLLLIHQLLHLFLHAL